MNEYEAMKDSFSAAKYGAFLIIPLKYDEEKLNPQWLEQHAGVMPFQTPDINNSVKQLMESKGKRYRIPRSEVLRSIAGEGAGEDPAFYAFDKSAQTMEFSRDARFYLRDFEFYFFHTQIAFLCVKLCFDHMPLLHTVSNLGYADNNALYYYQNAKGETVQIDLEQRLRQLCSTVNTELFCPRDDSVFLEAYTYTTAVVNRRFQHLETMRQAVFNLHLMSDLPNPLEDNSEEDINYVYAVKDQSLGSYRWGSCITSQTISYIVARSDLDIEDELHEQAENGLPVVLLALYQKYTCLRYQAILSEQQKLGGKKLKQLKKKLLEFQAYGTIAPANISRWHNIKQTYKYLMEENDIPEAIDKMSLSLNLLAEQQEEEASARSNAVMGLITIFGVVSIPSSVISLIDIMNGGNPVNRLATIVSLLSIVIMITVLMLYKRERK